MIGWLHTPLIFRLRELVEDPHENNRLSLTKVGSIIAMVTLSKVLWMNAAKFNLDWMDLIGYAAAMAIAASPALASKFIGVKFGNGTNGVVSATGGKT